MSPASREASADPHPRPGTVWGAVGRFGLRVLILYYLLYTLPAPLTHLPDLRELPRLWNGPEATQEEARWDAPDAVDAAYDWIHGLGAGWVERERAVVDRVAEDWLGFPQQLDRPYGSGDPTYSYVLLGVRAAAALALALLWFGILALSRRRDRFLTWLAPWIHVLGRYQLAFVLCGYGFAKVFPSQFRTPSLGRMETAFGDGSPMNLLWSFMGSSSGYTVFAGLMEVVPGLLLFFRRTALLGALLGAAVMANVAALNFFYDVPVKLYSSHLLLLALALAWRDRGALLALFLSRGPAPGADLSRPRTGWIGHGLRAFLVLPFLALAVDRTVDSYRNPSPLPELHGIWDVTQFQVEGEPRVPRIDDPLRFQALIVDRATFGWLKTMDGSLRPLQLAWEPEEGTLRLGTSARWDLEASGDELVMTGEYARTFRADPSDFSDPGESRDPQFQVRLVRAPLPEGEPTNSEVDAEPPLPAEDGAQGDAEEEAPLPPRLLGRWTVQERKRIGTVATRRRSTPVGWDAVTFHADGSCSFEYPLAVVRFEVSFRTVEERGEQLVGRLAIESGALLEAERPEVGELLLRGPFRGQSIEVRLQRRDPDFFLLQRRGFHWINEIPLNRY